MYNKPKIFLGLSMTLVPNLFSFERLVSLRNCSLKTEYYKHDLSVKVESNKDDFINLSDSNKNIYS